MIAKEIAHQKIAALVERFREQHDPCKDCNYNETLTRRDFLDSFFINLGWNPGNEIS